MAVSRCGCAAMGSVPTSCAGVGVLGRRWQGGRRCSVQGGERCYRQHTAVRAYHETPRTTHPYQHRKLSPRSSPPPIARKPPRGYITKRSTLRLSVQAGSQSLLLTAGDTGGEERRDVASQRGGLGTNGGRVHAVQTTRGAFPLFQNPSLLRLYAQPTLSRIKKKNGFRA
jgi:hypothetical protein